MSDPNQWIWSAPYQNHYRITHYVDGHPQYEWATPASQAQTQTQPQTGGQPLSTPGHSQGLPHRQPHGYGSGYPYGSALEQAQMPAHEHPKGRPRVDSGTSAPPNPGSPTSSLNNPSVYETQHSPSQPIATTAQHASPTQPQTASSPTRNAAFLTPQGPRGQQKEIRGAPERGEEEKLDPSYYIRPLKDSSRFFRRGRMFSILFTEQMGDTPPKTFRDDVSRKPFSITRRDNVSMVKFQEYVYSEIRRFVCVDSRSGFCYACPVFTYGNRATTKPGCKPQEHAIIYYVDLQTPTRIQGEEILAKNPIGVEPPDIDDPPKPMNICSRINFGTVYPIQYNVKVRDCGMVRPEDMDLLFYYYKTHLFPT